MDTVTCLEYSSCPAVEDFLFNIEIKDNRITTLCEPYDLGKGNEIGCKRLCFRLSCEDDVLRRFAYASQAMLKVL